MNRHFYHKKQIVLLMLFAFCFACKSEKKQAKTETPKPSVELIVLGIAQDAGYPQAACRKSCCAGLWNDPAARKMVSCIGLVDHENQRTYLFDATPDFKYQAEKLTRLLKDNTKKLPDAIFLTHAHIGHYTGLMHLGREAVGAKQIPVYAMPQMTTFLAENGPWSQLVSLENISLQPIQADEAVNLPGGIQVTPFLVPHRDEFSETVGYKITTPEKTYLFIPDIDKWEKWNRDIREIIRTTDYAFLDGSFYQNGEIPGRDMALIPHPFIAESMEYFKTLPGTEKQKVHFIHLNHTNPVLDKQSDAYGTVLAAGFRVAEEEKTY